METVDWEQGKGVQINITLEERVQEQWHTYKTINVLDSNNRFEISTPIKLSDSKPHPHNRRKKREDEENKMLRFGKVEILEKGNPEPIRLYDDEDKQYEIAFYNRLEEIL